MLLFKTVGQGFSDYTHSMTTEEVSFPRGWPARPTKKADSSRRKQEKDVLFGVGPAGTQKRSQRRHKKGLKRDTQADPEEEKLAMDLLNAHSLSEGVILLGCVQVVHDFGLKVSLPYGLVGVVSLTEVSQAYTALLHKFAHGEEDDTAVVRMIAMFRVGQPVVCKVVSVCPEGKGSGRRCLTLDPVKVNADLPAEALCAGMVIQAAVASVEDHGYSMDCGIHGMEAFLSHTESLKYLRLCNNGHPLAVGQILRCVVLSTSERALQLSVSPKRLESAQDNEVASLDSLVPGVHARLTVTQIRDQGIGVMWQRFEGCVHRTHLAQTWDLPQDYSVGQEVMGTLLYVHPGSQVPHWNLKALGRWQVPDGLAVGALVEDAKVVAIDSWGAHLELLDGGLRAVVPKAHVADKDVDDVRDELTPGQKCTCRIMAFNMVDCIAVATLKPSSFEGMHLTRDMFTLGMKLEGKVHKVLPSGMVLSMGPWMRGFVSRVHLGRRSFEVGQPVRCRLVQVEATCDPPRLWFTCHHGLLNSRRPPFCDYAEAVPGKIVDGLVVQATPQGLLVIFYGNVRGWVPAIETHRSPVPLAERYRFGQLVTCRVVLLEPEQERLTLSLKLDVDDGVPTIVKHVEETPIGEKKKRKSPEDVQKDTAMDRQCHAWAATYLLPQPPKKMNAEDAGHLEPETPKTANAIVMSTAVTGGPQETTEGDSGFPDPTKEHEASEVAELWSSKHSVPVQDDDTSPRKKDPKFQHREARNLVSRMKPGDKFEAIVLAVEKFQLRVSLLGDVTARVHVTLVDAQPPEGVNPLHQFKVSDTVDVYATNLKFQHTMPISGRKLLVPFELSHFQTSGNRNLMPGVTVTGFFSHIEANCVHLAVTPVRKAILPLLSMDIPASKLPFLAKQLKKGQAISGVVRKVHEDDTAELSQLDIEDLQPGQVVNARLISLRYTEGALLVLPLGCRGRMGLTDICDDFSKLESALKDLSDSQYTRCQILDMNPITQEYHVSARKSRVQGSTEVIDREVATLHDLQVGDTVKGIVSSCIKVGYFVNIGFQVDGLVHRSKLPAIHKHNFKALNVGSVVVVKVAQILKNMGKVDLDLVETLDGPTSYNRKSDDSQSSPRKRKTSETEIWCDESQEKKVKTEEDLPTLSLSEGFSWDVTTAPDLSRLVMTAETEKDDSDIEDEVPKRRKTAAEKKKAEAELRQKELALMDQTRKPDTEDEFDRLVLASPNSSIVWLQYMAFHLRQAEVEKARRVADRALHTINFREETEKLNIWKALLTLENTYGTKETLQVAFSEALKCNDGLTVHKHLMQIYVASSKNEEAEQLFKRMMSKYKSPEVCLLGGTFYMKLGKLEEARAVLQRALKSLERHHHVGLISKFALMEFKYGDQERGKSMFDNILVNHPKRTDLWSVYINILIKQGDEEGVRTLFAKAGTPSCAVQSAATCASS